MPVDSFPQAMRSGAPGWMSYKSVQSLAFPKFRHEAAAYLRKTLLLVVNNMAEPALTKEDCDHVELGEAHEKQVEAPPPLPDPEAERRLVRKLDRTILPWIMLLYLLSYLDR